MEKIGLSFLIGAVIGASFKTSVRGVKDNIGEIHSQVKRLTEERNTLLSKKYDTQNNFFKAEIIHKKPLVVATQTVLKIIKNLSRANRSNCT